MARNNNFDEAMYDLEDRFSLPDMMAIEKRLKNTHHSMQVSGDVLNLFLPNIMKTFINIFGGTEDDNVQYRGSSPANTEGMIRPSKPKAPGKK